MGVEAALSEGCRRGVGGVSEVVSEVVSEWCRRSCVHIGEELRSRFQTFYQSGQIANSHRLVDEGCRTDVLPIGVNREFTPIGT